MEEGLLGQRVFLASIQMRGELPVPIDISVGDDLAFSYQSLHYLPNKAVQLVIGPPHKVVVHMGLAFAAFDEGYLILLGHGLFYAA